MLSDKIFQQQQEVANTAMGGGALSSVGFALSGLSWGDVAAIVAAIVALAGFGLQLWAGIRRDRRQSEQHRIFMEKHIVQAPDGRIEEDSLVVQQDQGKL